MRRDRLFVESAIAARVDEARKQLRIVSVTGGLARQAHERPRRLADVGLEVCVELVGHREARVQLERAAERILGALFAVRSAVDVLADHAMASAQVSPGGSEGWIQIHGTR